MRKIQGWFEIRFIDANNPNPKTKQLLDRPVHHTNEVGGEPHEIRHAYDRLITVADSIAYPIRKRQPKF